MQEGQQPRTPVLFPDARSNSLVSWIDVLLCSLGSSLMSTLILQLQALTNSIVRSAQLAIRVLALRVVVRWTHACCHTFRIAGLCIAVSDDR